MVKLVFFDFSRTLVKESGLNAGVAAEHFKFDYLAGTQCEIKEGTFTGKILKMMSDKGEAVKQICQESDIKPKDCLAVGDSLADIAMFKEVGVGVALSKLEEVKKAADYVIEDFKDLVELIDRLN